MPAPALYTILTLNVVTFAAFGLDKWKAKKDRRRIPEAWLISLSWATGLLGGWLAMSFFRHKTRKTSFQIKMALATVLNLLWPILYYWG